MGSSPSAAALVWLNNMKGWGAWDAAIPVGGVDVVWVHIPCLPLG